MCARLLLRCTFCLVAVGYPGPAIVTAWSAPDGPAPRADAGRVGCIGRRERKRLTALLHSLSASPAPPKPSLRRRDRSLSQDAMVVDGVGAAGRLYCPVSGCPCSDTTRAKEWTSKQTLIAHVDSHLAGTLRGQVIGIHTVRAWTQRNGAAANKVLLKLDFANAFNRISRHHVLESATVQFSGLARWVTWCYQEPSALRFGTAVISLQRDFEFLGGAIGGDAFVDAHTKGRVEAVGPSLDALAALGDAQVGLRLLRSCAGYGRLVHSMRCNPPHCQNEALQLFDLKIQAAFSSITGLHLTAMQRAQVGRGLAFAGAGVRSSSLDAPAAFLASVGGCASACEEVDVDPACTQATAALNANLLHPLATADSWCPQCNGILDRLSLHAGTCVAGGEKTLRHTAVRDALCKWADRAGLQPEKERPGLLLPQRPGDVGTQNRRPADIFLPSLHGSPAALDLANGPPAGTGRGSSIGSSVQFVPLVAESTGAWERAASQLLLQIACSAAARTGDDSATLHSDLLQELSVIIRSHRASASEDDRLLLAHEMGRSIGPGSEDSMADGWSPIEYQLWNASNAGESTSLQVVMRSSDASGWSGNSYTLTSGGSQLSSDTLLSGMYDGSVSVAVNVGQELSLGSLGVRVSSTDPDLIKFPTALTFTIYTSIELISLLRVVRRHVAVPTWHMQRCSRCSPKRAEAQKYKAEAAGATDCVSLVSCRPDRKRGWRATEGQWPECEKSPGETLSAAVRDFLCSTLPSENSWYDFEGYERARLRYRFGTADRAHCAVPAWRYLREEPLRLYSLLQAKLEATKILINIGAGDASIDDPLGNILRNFAGGKTWSGVYFDAVPENCEKVRQAMDETNSEIRVHCGFSTPDSVVSAICRSLQGVPGMKETCQSAGVTRVAAVDARAARIDVDALSIDIDSFDCAVLREVLRVVSPKMVSVEVMPLPPPVSVLTEFHPQHLRSANANMSGYAAISGGTTRQGGFFPGCSLSAAIALLWPNSLGLYRLSARDALFVRKDVAELVLGEDWRPADEFQCWRHLCADLGLTANLMNLTSLGVYRRLMPFVHDMLKERFFQVQQSHPFTLAVAMPPPSQELPSVKLWKKSCLLIGSATLPSSVSGLTWVMTCGLIESELRIGKPLNIGKSAGSRVFASLGCAAFGGKRTEALSRLETKNTGETLQVEEHILQLQALKYFLSGSKPF
ncbi:Retrovirus-related Pol polyprotein from transposon TNT 1-94 [Durusdinium trenchii]|uniref:Retrovirus-related Pol polyprotein from transposon TNT 1-94 n=1 Tax=Durusdinium trenchii TaxID=1381693 RepID=A0ABP0RRE1_9DINO